MNNEAHLPAKQTSKKKDPWVSGSYENCERPQGNQTPPPRRTQDTRPLITNCFPKRLKLKKRVEFKKIFRQGQRLVGRYICIDWFVSDRSETRLGITASRRYGPAHERNRFKRLVREAFRLSRMDLPNGLDLNVAPRQYARSAPFAAIQGELVSLLTDPVKTSTCETPSCH
jgi:ribonuclease P protein component